LHVPHRSRLRFLPLYEQDDGYLRSSPPLPRPCIFPLYLLSHRNYPSPAAPTLNGREFSAPGPLRRPRPIFLAGLALFSFDSGSTLPPSLLYDARSRYSPCGFSFSDLFFRIQCIFELFFMIPFLSCPLLNGILVHFFGFQFHPEMESPFTVERPAFTTTFIPFFNPPPWISLIENHYTSDCVSLNLVGDFNRAALEATPFVIFQHFLVSRTVLASPL